VLDLMCHLCHIGGVKTISIKQLHEKTGKCVREAQTEAYVVTDHGRQVAILKAFSESDLAGRPFPRRGAGSLPDVGIDTTEVISRDRDGR